jgi:tetratricopeptide (TPR) repeat protein
MQGDFSNAVEPFKRSVKMDPSNPIVRMTYGQVLAFNGESALARDVFESLVRDMPETLFAKLARLYELALAGNREEALRALQPDMEAAAKEDLQYSWSVAECLALIGEADRSIEWLGNAVKQGLCNYPLLAELDPLLSNVRANNAFKTLMASVKERWEAIRPVAVA